ncbi:PA14 domain-containing protein [Runella sp.]|uniref:PA14 domain-containing protein n=1 Tax=Runella sp. TaxID=1960881 RepID=UPI002618FF93|nr:PA14 domain-containing protein [Runella sp.]
MTKFNYTTRSFFLFLLIWAIASLELSAQNCVGTPGQVKWSYWTAFNNVFPDSTDLAALENFPSRPDGSQLLSSLKAPVNYTEYFAAMMRGYIYVNQTATYRFNLTGDDRAIFYLSTNDAPANKRKRAEVTSYTGITEYNKTTGQTSQVIELIGGQNYYFEIYTFEGCCGDHSTLYWRKNTNPDTTWRVIDFNNLKEYACEQTCPPRGTACNDGNAQTQNDQQDGFCNCVGTMPTANKCVGERGVVEAYYFDNITGSRVEPDLINSPKFPLLPDRKEKLKGIAGPNFAAYAKNTYGSLVQGFLTVPVSGTYEFNLTGDDQTFFYLSKNDSIQYKLYRQATLTFGVDETAHTTYATQTIAPLFLEKGKYYYYEIRHKENTGRDHFNLYWKTPFHEFRTWKRVSDFYLHDYKCEVSCVPNNTPCNDGNAFTKNDKFLNCECVGTPCSGPDCDDVTAQYQKYNYCAPTQNITNTSDVAWVSCATAANPNSARGGQNHWIKYDFGSPYTLKGTRVWNYNVVNETNKGFKTVYVDYSTDGTTWKQLGGVYTWPTAPGTAQYVGFLGPDFNSVKARYVLITATQNWGNATCSGFSKITFDATKCDLSGVCNDGDPLTVYDRYDNNCNCKGVKLACIEDTIRTGSVSVVASPHNAKKAIFSDGNVPTSQNIAFTAGKSIVLLPGFKVNGGATFSAKIAACLQAAFAQEQLVQKTDSTASEFGTELTEESDIRQIVFRLNKPGQVSLLLKDKEGQILATLIDDYYQNLGTQIKYLPTARLPKGMYLIELTANETKISQQFMVE